MSKSTSKEKRVVSVEPTGHIATKFTINVVFGDETTIERNVANFPGEDEQFIDFLCESFEIPRDSLIPNDIKKIKNALRELRTRKNVVVELEYKPKEKYIQQFANIMEFFIHHLHNTKSANFWVHYSTWPDLWAKIKLLFFKDSPPRNFENLYVCDMERITAYDLKQGLKADGKTTHNTSWPTIIQRIGTEKNAVYILEDFDIVLDTEDNFGGENEAIKSRIKNLIEGKHLQENNTYIIVAANASDEIRIPSQLRGLWVKYKDTSKDYPVLESLGENITAKAVAKKIDAIQGRDDEIQEIIQKLSMDKYNNVLLLGRAGVGKTAIVNGLALRIAEGTVPDKLKNIKLFDIPFSNLIRDANVAGSLEARVSNLRDEVKAHRREVIVFFDEFHQMMTNDTIRNILKPVLANGEFPCIGATTDEEYQQYIANVDPAFEQRFLKIYLDELPKDVIKDIFRTIIERKNRDITVDDTELEYLYFCCKKLEPLLALPRSGEKILTNILEEIDDGAKITKELIKRHFSVGRISYRLNNKGEYDKVHSNIARIIKGQDKQIHNVINSIRNHYLLLTKIERPLVLLFMGPTGTGKTELAKHLASQLWGDENRFLLFNMGSVDFKTSITGAPPGYVGYENSSPILEFMKSKDSGIIVLDEFEKVFAGRDALSDKLSVLDSFLEIFDKGTTTDNRGKRINCRPYIFILTSNLAQEMEANTSEKEKTQTLVEAGLKKEFIGRLGLIEIFSRISEEMAIEIIKEQLEDINTLPDYNCKFKFDQNLIEYILQRSDFYMFGARNLKYTFDNIMKHILSENLDILDNNTTYLITYNDGMIELTEDG